MELKEIKEELLQAVELIADFESSHLAIDRDTALVKLRRAYEALRFCNAHADVDVESFECIPTEPTAPEVEVEFIMPEPVVAFEPQTEAVEEPEAEPEVEVTMAEVEPEVEVIPEPEPEVEVEVKEEPEAEEVIEQTTEEVAEPVVEPEPTPEPEPEVEIEPEPVVETEPEPTPEPAPAIQTAEPSLFGDDDIWGRPAPSRRRIISLYGEDETPKPRRKKIAIPAEETPAPEVPATPEVAAVPTEPATPEVATVPATAEEPAAPVAPVEPAAPAPAPVVTPIASTEPPQILADTIEAPKSIADTIVAAPSVAESSAVTSLVSSISVGDRFMLLRELFGSNEDLYEKTIEKLDAMDNLDDCIIYIAENFSWRSSSDGAKLLMDLLQRKLG